MSVAKEYPHSYSMGSIACAMKVLFSQFGAAKAWEYFLEPETRASPFQFELQHGLATVAAEWGHPSDNLGVIMDSARLSIMPVDEFVSRLVV